MALLRQRLFEVRAAAGRGPFDPLPINGRDLPQERAARTSPSATRRSTARNLRVLSKAVIHQLI
ncbi:hypothetical protein [Variovorax sp. OV329]|uniref:hypothetical protein n=1 Tax=Variovorax sp. OV329 TaxID=1882825 RepID=UPI0008E3C829|nr:hypothetical protein [Variovorax sp. OV329]SFN02692.1 hypothetical protein SAMN05444747_11377 [Variovorax sp. OV329]